MKDNSNSQGDCQSSGGTVNGVIYKITNKINGKLYVGQTRQKLNNRIKGHKHSKVKRGVDAAIAKHGWENFSVEVIEECPVESLDEREIFWIAELNSKAPNGYNLTDGGDGGGSNPSKETRAKISANHADVSGEKNPFYGQKHSEETRAIISATKKGKSHKPHSQETRDKISAGNKGKHVSAETRAKISASEKGKPISEETRAKMSAAHKGKKHAPRSPETKAKISAAGKGRKHTPETRAKMSAAQKARWARKKAVENGDKK